MKNTGQVLAGILGFGLLAWGGYYLLKASKPNTANGNTEVPPAEQGTTTNTTSTDKPKVVKGSHHVATVSNPPSTLSTTPSTATIQKVYANSTGVDVKLIATGTTEANPIVLGETVRTTESKGEELGAFTKYITIFAIPYVLFKESYSGRSVLIPKIAVTIK